MDLVSSNFRNAAHALHLLCNMSTGIHLSFYLANYYVRLFFHVMKPVSGLLQ